MKKIFIYGLFDPFLGECRYVGITGNCKNRLSKHLTEKSNAYKFRWINKMKSLNKTPIMKILEVSGEFHWAQREQWWIRYFKKKGQKLTNLTAGGEGSFGIPCSQTKRSRISKSLMGHKVSLETRGKQSVSAKKRFENPKNHPLYGKKMSLQWRKNLSESHKGIRQSAETKKKKSEAMKKCDHPLWTHISIGDILNCAKEIGFKRNDIAKKLSVSNKTITNRVQFFGYKNWSDFCIQNNG